MIHKCRPCVSLQVSLVTSIAWVLQCVSCQANSGFTPDSEPLGYIPSELLVQCAEETTEEQRQIIHKLVGASVLRSFEFIGWQHVRLPEGISTEAGLQAYLNTPGVEAAEVNSTCVINVTSSDPLDRVVSGSNYGVVSVDLAAPGVNIYTTDLNSYITGVSGTSMAAAHVSGALALMAAADPALSPLTLKDTLLRSVEPIDAMSGLVLSSGRLDLANAVKALPRTAPEVRAIGHTEGPLQFSWPTWAADFQLQETGELGLAAEWRTVLEAPLVQGDRCVLTLETSDFAKFYRLHRPSQ